MWVDGGALTASISRALVLEGRALARTPTTAEVTARVDAQGEVLLVEVSRRGARLAQRTVSLAGGPDPALRVVVLLIADALDARPAPLATTSTAPAPPPRPPAAPPPSPGWGLGLALSASTWSGPLALELGLAVSLRTPLRLLGARLAAEVAIHPCCALARPQVLTGSSFQGALLARAELPLLDGLGGELALAGALGLGVRRVEATALLFPGDPTARVETALEARARLGLRFARPVLERWALTAGAGVEARMGRLRVALPAPEVYGDVDLDPGPLAPWVEVGGAVSF